MTKNPKLFLIPVIILTIIGITCSTAVPEKDPYANDLSKLIRVSAKNETIKTIGEILKVAIEKMNADEISFAKAFVRSYNEYVQKYKAEIKERRLK